MKKFLTPKTFFIIGLILSSALYTVLLIDQLRIEHVGCTPDDNLCNSGNTIIGDVTWAGFLAAILLVPTWVVAILVGVIVKWIVSGRKAKSLR